MPPVRRLTAILAADVAGYSRLMGADEEGTHARLGAHFAELVHPKILEYRGRVVKNTGDGLLAEFASVLDAVRCAAAVQEGMSDRNSPIPTDERIEFRVGVNLGDVIAEGDDIFGDGVNIAARLEGLVHRAACASRAPSSTIWRSASLCLRGSGRAERQEYRPTCQGLCAPLRRRSRSAKIGHIGQFANLSTYGCAASFDRCATVC